MEKAKSKIIDNITCKRVLVVDDEVEIAELVVQLLADAGIEAYACFNGESALVAANEQMFDLAILDVMMPGMDGFELCTRLCALSDMSVIFLSAKDEEADLVVGLTLGADDYITKPFKPRELLARVRARLRRQARQSAGQSECGKADNAGAVSGTSSSAGATKSTLLEVSGIELNTKTHKAALLDVPLELTPKEFAILRILMEHSGQPVSVADIYTAAWNEPANSSSANTIMVHIRHLRKKLAAIDSSRTLIETTWGVGYCVVEYA